MDSSTGPQLIWGITMLVLLAGSLFARRIALGQFVRYSLIWALIFAGVYGVVLFRPELSEVWARAKADLTGDAAPSVVGETTVIRRAPDGHYWVDAEVNGQSMRFLIDSGATSSILSDTAASALGLNGKDGSSVMIETANGVINGWPVEVPLVRVGTIEVRPLEMMVTDGGGDTNILGMNWLNRLGSWKVEQGVMTITP